MTKIPGDQPTTYEIYRTGKQPIPFSEAGKVGLSRIVQVTPAPRPNPFILQTVASRDGVTITELGRDSDGGEGTFEIRSPGQSVESMSRIETAIEHLASVLNAGDDPAAYDAAIHTSSTRPTITYPRFFTI
jgi:hypothetical protein